MGRQEHFDKGTTDRKGRDERTVAAINRMYDDEDWQTTYNRKTGESDQLFDTEPFTKPEPEMDYDPEKWLARQDISWHASDEPTMPSEANEPSVVRTSFGYGFHHGSLPSAMQRGRITSPSAIASADFLNYGLRPYMHPVRVTGEMALREEPNKPGFSNRRDPKVTEAHEAHPLVFSDSQANLEGVREVEEGKTVPYINTVEDIGSISYRSPRENLRTWAEDVTADPGASREHKLLAEQFDLTVPARENWVSQRLGRQEGPSSRRLPESLSGEVVEQPSLFGDEGDTKLSGQSEVVVNQPKFKKKRPSLGKQRSPFSAVLGEEEPA